MILSLNNATLLYLKFYCKYLVYNVSKNYIQNTFLCIQVCTNKTFSAKLGFITIEVLKSTQNKYKKNLVALLFIAAYNLKLSPSCVKILIIYLFEVSIQFVE